MASNTTIVPTDDTPVNPNAELGTKIVLMVEASLFGILAIFSFVFFIRAKIWGGKKKALMSPLMVYLTSFLFASVRGFLAWVGAFRGEWFTTVMKTHMALFIYLDILPESLAFCTYLLLLFTLVDLYYRSRVYENAKPRRQIWYAFWGIYLFTWLIFVSYSVYIWRIYTPRAGKEARLFWTKYLSFFEMICIAGMSVVLLIGFVIYSTVLIKRLKKLLIPDHHKRSFITKLQILVVLCTTCFFLHAMALIFSHFHLIDGTLGKDWRAQTIFFLLNDIVTEFLPFFSILMLLGFFFRRKGKRKKSKKEKRMLLEQETDDTPSSCTTDSWTSEGREDLVQ